MADNVNSKETFEALEKEIEKTEGKMNGVVSEQAY